DLVGDGVDVAEPRPVLGPGQLDIGRAGDVLGHVPGMADVDPRVTAAVQDQGRDVDPWEHVAHVEAHVHADDVLGHRRAGGHPQIAGPPAAVAGVVELTRVAAVPPLARRPGPL